MGNKQRNRKEISKRKRGKKKDKKTFKSQTGQLNISPFGIWCHVLLARDFGIKQIWLNDDELARAGCSHF